MDQLEIFVEFFRDVDYDSFNQVKVAHLDNVRDIIDFYDKVQRLPFRVRKFSFEVKSQLNDCHLEFRDFPFDETDCLDFTYRFQDNGEVSKEFYMDFLHNAYKEDKFILNSTTSGNWLSFKFGLSPV